MIVFRWYERLKRAEKHLTSVLVCAIVLLTLTFVGMQIAIVRGTVPIEIEYPTDPAIPTLPQKETGRKSETTQVARPAPDNPHPATHPLLTTKEGAEVMPLHLNTADVTTLQQLPGIGPKRAQDIIQYRDRQGSFQSEWELKKVSGIGEKTFARIRPYLETFGPRESTTPAKTSKVKQSGSTPKTVSLPEHTQCPSCGAPIHLTHGRYPHRPPYCPSCLSYLGKKEPRRT